MIIRANSRLTKASHEQDMAVFYNMVSDICKEYDYITYDYGYEGDSDVMHIWARSKDKMLKVVLSYKGKWDLGVIK